MPLGLSRLLSRAVNETTHLLSFQIPQQPILRGVSLHLNKLASLTRNRTEKFVRRSTAPLRTILLATIIPVTLVPLFLYVMWWAIRRFWMRGTRTRTRPRPDDQQRSDGGEDQNPDHPGYPMHPVTGDRSVSSPNPAGGRGERSGLPHPERQRSQAPLRGEGSDGVHGPENPLQRPAVRIPRVRVLQRRGENPLSHPQARSGPSRSRSQSRSRAGSSQDDSDVIDISPRPPSGVSFTTGGTVGESRPPSSMAHYDRDLGRQSYEVGRTSSLSATRPWVTTNTGTGIGTFTSTRRASDGTSLFSAQATLTPLTPVPPVPPVPQLPPLPDLPPLVPVPQLPALPPPPLSPLPPIPSQPDHSPTAYSPRRPRPLPVTPHSRSSGDGSGSSGHDRGSRHSGNA